MKKINWYKISLVLSAILALCILFASIIPNLYRWYLVTFIVILDLLAYIWVYRGKKRSRNNRIHVILKLVLILFILIPNSLFYRFVQQLSTRTETYVINFVSLEDIELNSVQELSGKSIGILSDMTSKIAYIYPKQIDKTNKLNINFVEYDSYIEALQALQKNKIEIIILPEGYENTFGSIIDFKIDTSELHTIWTESFKERVSLYLPDSDVLNIVLIGGDSPIKGSSTSGFNYDVIVVVSYNFRTNESAMISVPRDSYVYNTCTDKRDKITHTGWYGADCLTASLTKFLDIPINHYMLIDFEGLIDVVDSIGGVEIDVQQHLEDSYINQDTTDLVILEPGLQVLNGQEALTFLRNRKTLEDGAIGRANNHEIFVLALIQELAKPTKWLRLSGFMDTLQKSALTNLSAKSIVNLYNQVNLILKAEGIDALLPERLELSGKDAMIYTPSFGAELYYYILDTQSVNEVKLRLKQINTLE